MPTTPENKTNAATAPIAARDILKRMSQSSLYIRNTKVVDAKVANDHLIQCATNLEDVATNVELMQNVATTYNDIADSAVTHEATSSYRKCFC